MSRRGGSDHAIQLPAPNYADREIREEYRQLIDDLKEVDVYYDTEKEALYIKPRELPTL